MPEATNPYCTALGIEVPTVEKAAESREANFYGLLIAYLLERGEPVTLEEAAARFEKAGVAPAARALTSLKRCRPARPPVYRYGQLYALDPYDREAEFWTSFLDLRPAEPEPLRVVRKEPGPVPTEDRPLTVENLDEAWADAIPGDWSAQRVALCILDAHGGAMKAEDVVAFASERGAGRKLSVDKAKYWRRGAPIKTLEDDRWQLDPDHKALRGARRAVIGRIEVERRRPHPRYDPVVAAVHVRQREKRAAVRNAELARMKRGLVHAFPPDDPQAAAVVHVGERDIQTFVGDEMAMVVEALSFFDVLGAIDVRPLLRSLGFDPGPRRLAELGPPQKTRTIDSRGRTLKITTELLVEGSCGISRPFGDPSKMRGYLATGKKTQLRRRLQTDAKSLYALYQYGRLHGTVRLRWGFLDEPIPAPWVYPDEKRLYHLKKESLETGVPLEVVVGSAAGWNDPWSRVERAFVVDDPDSWQEWLVDASGRQIFDADVQLARLAGSDSNLV